MQNSAWSSHRQVTTSNQQNIQQQHQNQQVIVALNDRLYNNAKAIFEQKSAILLSKYSATFIEEVIRHT